MSNNYFQPFTYYVFGFGYKNKDQTYAIKVLDNTQNYFINLAEWNGFPKDLDVVYVEKILNAYGVVGIWKLANKWMTTPVIVTKRDYWGKPIEGRALNVYAGMGGMSEQGEPITITGVTLNLNNCLFIMNNLEQTPTGYLSWSKMLDYGKLFNDYVYASRWLGISHVVGVSSENEQGKDVNIQNKINNALDKESGSPIRAMEIDIDWDLDKSVEVAAKLQGGITQMKEALIFIKNEIKEELGIMRNSNPDKKQRLVADEIGIETQATNLILETRIKARELCFTQAKKLFGWTLSFNHKEMELANEGDNEGELNDEI